MALLLACTLVAVAQKAEVKSPDGRLAVAVDVADGRAFYKVTYDGETVMPASPLGLVADVGDFSQGLTLQEQQSGAVDEHYELNRSKVAHVHYVANELTLQLRNARRQPLDVRFRVSNNDIAFRYEMPRQGRRGETGAVRIMEEKTGFAFPEQTTTFLCPQSDAMIGWKRTKPSYEEKYKADAPLTARSQYGHGYTFPCLFHTPTAWVLVSETGVDSRYCASHLSDWTPAAATGSVDCYTIAFPMAEENNGNGTPEPAFALPGTTPWRTITVGTTLAPIVETTAPFDNVAPRYASQHDYKFGRGTWSWIVWQDNSMNYDDQVHFINLAKQLGYEYILIDAGWDIAIGKERMERLIEYAHSQGVDVFLWFSSSGYWNDIVQSPINAMDNPIQRKEWMRWMQKNDVKGIKVDFFGGDKQETMRLYEAILSDADDHALMVIFHGCTLPRGWERMYPNYVGSEAVLASENLIFGQDFCDEEAFNACLHPYIRNAVGCMEFGGSVLNRRLSRGNKGGTIRRTTDSFELATAVLFQNPIQNFALTPENLEPEDEGGAPAAAVDFMKRVPTTWEETRFIDGYPGRYVVLARRHHGTWYIAGVNAGTAPLKLTLDLSAVLTDGAAVELYTDNLKNQDPKYDRRRVLNNVSAVKVTMAPNGGFVMKAFEGLSLSSVDEDLQERISALEIVPNSAALGSGSVMRLSVDEDLQKRISDLEIVPTSADLGSGSIMHLRGGSTAQR